MAVRRPSARMGTGGRRGRGPGADQRDAGGFAGRTDSGFARGARGRTTDRGAEVVDGSRRRPGRSAVGDSEQPRGRRSGVARPGARPEGSPRTGGRSDTRFARGAGRGRSVEREPRGADVSSEEPQDEFISGRRAVMEALKSGRPINKILVQESASGGGLGELLALAREQSAVVQQVPKAKLDEVAKNKSHQGVLAYVAAKPYVDLDDLIAIAKRSYPGLIVVLDGLEDPHNLGSVLRSVDGAGAAGVVIPKRRAVPLTGTVSKASAGALEHVEVARVSNMSQALDDLKKAGFWVMGAAGEANTLYTDADLTGNIALVIGNEGTGLGKLVRERCDALIKLPMYGQVNSLNAGVATGILLYEVLRQRAAKG